MSIKKCIIICDPGSCHQGNRLKAQELIMEAKIAGAGFIKFQLFPQKMFPHNPALPYKMWSELVKYANEVGIGIFASVFDEEGLKTAVEGGSMIKIAYSQRHNLGLIQKAWHEVGYKKVIISGDEYTAFSDKVKCLLCVPRYPADPEEYDIENFDPTFYDGISDHTKGWELAVEAVKRGAKIIEKHIRFEYKQKDVPDSYLGHALKPSEFSRMVEEIKRI